jgi:hypothetical protein
VAAPSAIHTPDEGVAIDWFAQSHDEALNNPPVARSREFGPHHRADSDLEPAPAEPAHRRGEQYRTATGETVVWVSDFCYVVSEDRPGTPQALARARPARTVCPRGREARGDLFKDLPAYQKYHTE